jgi:NAD(P)-dependent dehydrogenase (short-subunit alcohol dehydrogenase family)
MPHPVLSPGHAAVVTGAASGIGLEACKRFAALGMKVCLADLASDALDAARAAVAEAAPDGDVEVIAVAVDVADAGEVARLKGAVDDAFGGTDLLMNNAVMREKASTWSDPDIWQRNMAVNFFGVVNGVQAFLPDMLAAGRPGMIVNSGSKQGITNPPGNAPYNVAKAALKSYTELLQHELRNTKGAQVSAHLLIPGMTTTGAREHRPGAWWPSQVIDVMVAALQAGDFYILCPDGEVTPEMDEKRMRWAAGDVYANRPALSRWHPDHKAAFGAFHEGSG